MASPNGVTTILFDLDGTLRHSVPLGTDFFIGYARQLGARIDDDLHRKAARWAHQYWAESECLMHDLKTYGRENAEFWRNYARRQLEAIDTPSEAAIDWAPKIHQHMMDSYRPEDVVPPDVFPTLAVLKQAGYTLGLVTNRHQPVDDYIAELGLDAYLDFFFAAGEIDAWKPDPEIFYYALGRAQAKPSQAIYIGDNYYANVQRAVVNPVADGIANRIGFAQQAGGGVQQPANQKQARCQVDQILSLLPELLGGCWGGVYSCLIFHRGWRSERCFLSG